MDSFRLFRAGRMWSAFTNLVLSLVLCLGAASLGLSLFAPEVLPAASPIHP